MRGSDLYRCLEAIVRCTEIHHRSGAEADIVHIRTCIGDSFEKIFVYLIRRYSCIPADKHLVSSGRVVLVPGLAFETVDVDADTGAVEVDGVDVKTLKISNDTGRIKVANMQWRQRIF